MKKALVIATVLASFFSSSVALDAEIDQNPPSDVVLTEENNYSVQANYSSTRSSPSEEINTRNWIFLDSTDSELGTDSGVEADYIVTRGGNPSINTDTLSTIRLIVDNGSDQDIFEVPQTIYDEPNSTVSANQTTITKGEYVKFSSNVTNTFNDPVEYNWSWDESSDLSENASSFEKKFGSTGTYNVWLNVTDDEGYSSLSSNITVNVNSQNNDDPDDEETDETDDSPSPSGPGGPSGPVAPTNPDENQTDNQTSNENKTDNEEGKPNLANTSRKNVVAESRNGVAKVNVTKGEGLNEISVSVNPASDKASVKNIRISSGKSGQVSVSVRDVGNQKPPQVPGHASRDEQNVYSYQEINTSINDSEVDLAEVDFSVNKSWVDERNRSKDEVVMKRFNNDSWESLDTRYLNETDDEYNFEASSEGFSYYAVALEEPANQTEEEQMDSENESSQQSNYMIYLLVVLGLLAVVGVVYLRKSRNSQNSEFDMDSY